MVPKIPDPWFTYILYNLLLLSMSGSHEYDVISLLFLGYESVDFEIIKLILSGPN